MVCYDLYCFLCGNPMGMYEEKSGYNLYRSEINKISTKKSQPNTFKKDPIFEKIGWMLRGTFLSACDKIIHGCETQYCNGNIRDKKNNVYTQKLGSNGLRDSDVGKHGLMVHTDCWKHIEKKYNIKLKYSDLPIPAVIKNKDFGFVPFDFIDYKEISNYWGQVFEFNMLLENNDIDLCISPLESDKTSKRIDKIFSYLKIKSDRVGPHGSATFYEENTVKLGNNNKFWIVKNGKWTPFSEITKHTIIANGNSPEMKYVISLKCIGEPMLFNAKKNSMVFVSDIVEKKKNIFTIELYTIQ